MFSFIQRSQHLSHQADLRCVWGSQVPALPSSWQIMFLISVSAFADGWCWSYRVLTHGFTPTVQSSSIVAHQRFRTRFNISHNIECMVRCAMLCIIWYFYLYKQVAHFRYFDEKSSEKWSFFRSENPITHPQSSGCSWPLPQIPLDLSFGNMLFLLDINFLLMYNNAKVLEINLMLIQYMITQI